MSGFWTLKIGGGRQEKKKPLKRERNVTSTAMDSSTQGSSSDVVRSLVERALTDAEQLVESIKIKAQREAEEEITRITEQAGQSNAEISSLSGVAEQSQSQVETVPAPAEEVEERVEMEAEEQAEMEAEPATTEYIEEHAVLEAESTTAETAEPATDELAEVPSAEEEAEDKEPSPAAIELDREAMYSEDIELAIAVPVDLVAVSKLYNNLQTNPEIKILYTRGSWDRGTVITVTLEKPLPLMDIISNIPGIEVTPIETPEKDSTKATPSALLGGERGEIKRIDLRMKAR
jgi:hypothetical protein